jgi:hypothetical protein
LGGNVDTIQNIEAVLYSNKEVDLEVNSEKAKYVLMSRKTIEQKRNIKISNRSSEGVENLKYFGVTITDQNCMPEEVKSRNKLGYACYHSVQSHLSSRLLSRNVKVKTHKTVILPLVLYVLKLGLSH